MSIEAIAWVLNDAPVPEDRRDASSLTLVLIGLANHADPNGRNAFPSVARLARYSRLCERTIRTSLDRLEQLDLIRHCDPEILAAHIKRADRRPQGWDLAITRSKSASTEGGHGMQAMHPAAVNGVHSLSNGVQPAHRRGALVAPEPPMNRDRTRPKRADGGKQPLPPVCGRCDARPGDPAPARIVWLDDNRTRSRQCPRCHPRA